MTGYLVLFIIGVAAIMILGIEKIMYILAFGAFIWWLTL